MKIPSVQTTEGVVLLIVVGVVAYVSYRAYKTGSGIASGVTQTVGDIVDSVKSATVDNVGIAAAKANRISNGIAIDPINQSAAETDRLFRQANTEAQVEAANAQTAEDDAASYGGMGVDSTTISFAQDYSPSAVGSK